MTPERWQRIAELFEAAVLRDAAGRESWLPPPPAETPTCAPRSNASSPRTGGPSATESCRRPRRRRRHRTGRRAGARRVAADDREVPRPITPAAGPSVYRSGGFTPREAIAPHSGRNTVSEPQSVVRARLRELPVIYIVMLGIALFWKRPSSAARTRPCMSWTRASSWPSSASSSCSRPVGGSRWPG